MDDGLNWIPALLSAWLMIVSTFFLGLDVRNAVRIYKRDCRKHASPNSAHTEAACAGALRVELAGDAYYFGKLYKKPAIGDRLRPICPEDIRRANRMLYASSVLALAIGMGIRIGLGGLGGWI